MDCSLEWSCVRCRCLKFERLAIIINHWWLQQKLLEMLERLSSMIFSIHYSLILPIFLLLYSQCYWQSSNKPYISEILGSHIGESENQSSGILCCLGQHVGTTISGETACQAMKCHIQNTAILKQISTLVPQSSRLCGRTGKGEGSSKLPRNLGHWEETLGCRWHIENHHSSLK